MRRKNYSGKIFLKGLIFGLYLIYTGIRILMKAPQEKSLGYTVTVVIAAVIISVIIDWASRHFVSYPMPR
jgi:hypothetical protein